MTQLCIVGLFSAKWINDGTDTPQAATQVSLTEVLLQAGKKGEPIAKPYGSITYTIEEDDRFDKAFWENRLGRAVLVVASPNSEEFRTDAPTLGSHSIHSVFDFGPG